MGSPRTDIGVTWVMKCLVCLGKTRPSLAQFAEEGTLWATAAVCMCRPALCARMRTVSGPSLEAVGCSSCGSLLLSPHPVALKSAEGLGQIPRRPALLSSHHIETSKKKRDGGLSAWALTRSGYNLACVQCLMCLCLLLGFA